ncbi:excalibur calcium-binding domain-containing protein [Streptomyces sp. NPDC006668]|uniref:excalibur calcium-binding domain-containing protein n=1 Tax=Streptomyces sp. NPDC006668 TaxID=3156903 RepID=UPI0033C80D20
MAPRPSHSLSATPTVTITRTREPSSASPAPYVYYKNCDAARAAGAAPLHRGDPGYRTELDRDGDGVACEPYHG